MLGPDQPVAPAAEALNGRWSFPKRKGWKDVKPKNVSIYKSQASALEQHAAPNWEMCWSPYARAILTSGEENVASEECLKWHRIKWVVIALYTLFSHSLTTLIVPYDQRNNPPQHPRIVYPSILDINYFCHFLDILRNYDPIDDEPMWAANHVVALTPGSTITIPETVNEFAIKGNIIKIFYHGLREITQEVLNAVAGGIFLYKTPNQAYQLLEDKVLLKLDWGKNQKTKTSLKKTVDFTDEEEAKFMQTFCKTRFYHDYRDRDSNRDNWRSSGRNDYNRDNYRSNTDDKPYDLQKQFNDFMKSQQPTNAFVNETFMNLKTQLETIAKNHQALIQNLETKFDRLADKQSGRTSVSSPSNIQPNPRGGNSKAYQPPQARNEHVNAVFTRSGKPYNPPDNPDDQQNNSKNHINFDSDDEDDEPTPQPKT
ncbi:hypothetical protein Tco_0542532 [Tanacetum coccineum]